MEATALDNPVWGSLTGVHAGMALGDDRARRYPSDVAPFAALADPRDPHCWVSLSRIVGPEPVALVAGIDEAPEGWEVPWRGVGVQMVADGLKTMTDDEAVVLGTADAPDMLDLVARTRPGPFRPRTVTLGRYLGIRRNGALIAMAGERLHPAGWTEISAVCTDPDHRGQGLATRLVRAVAWGIEERGERVVLHVAAENTGAIRLYESIGFVTRRSASIGGVRLTGAGT